MADDDNDKKKETAKNPDAAREELDQFTVMQETEDTHDNELSARNMETGGAGAAPEDIVDDSTSGNRGGKNKGDDDSGGVEGGF